MENYMKEEKKNQIDTYIRTHVIPSQQDQSKVAYFLLLFLLLVKIVGGKSVESVSTCLWRFFDVACRPPKIRHVWKVVPQRV